MAAQDCGVNMTEASPDAGGSFTSRKPTPRSAVASPNVSTEEGHPPVSVTRFIQDRISTVKINVWLTTGQVIELPDQAGHIGRRRGLALDRLTGPGMRKA